MSRLVSRFGGGIAALALLLVATPAFAGPITYQFTSGSADISVDDTASGTTVLDPAYVQANSGNAVYPIVLDGLEVVVDFSAGSLVNMTLTTTGPWTIPLDSSLSGGYDSVTVQSASISASGGVIVADPSVPGGYLFQINNVVVSALVDADGPLTGPITGVPISYVNPAVSGSFAITGTGFLDDLVMNGITIGVLTSPLSGQSVTVKADFLWRGANPVPEPHAALLFGIGAIAVGFATRKRLE